MPGPGAGHGGTRQGGSGRAPPWPPRDKPVGESKESSKGENKKKKRGEKVNCWGIVGVKICQFYGGCGAPKAYLEQVGWHVVVQEECSVHQEVREVVHSIPNTQNLKQNTSRQSHEATP